jgi:hypothetical protein
MHQPCRFQTTGIISHNLEKPWLLAIFPVLRPYVKLGVLYFYIFISCCRSGKPPHAHYIQAGVRRCEPHSLIMFSPFGSMPANATAAWHPEPDFRGTYSILSSCLLTMALCVWTALHLNVPEHKKPFQQTLRKFGYLVTGLFAPEVVCHNSYFPRQS